MVMIELTGIFLSEDAPDHQALGIDINEEDTVEGPVLVNIEHIVYINPTQDGKAVTIFLKDAGTLLYKQTYEEVKQILQMAQQSV